MHRAPLIVLCCAILSACGKDSPTSPSPNPSTTERRILVQGDLEFGDVIVGQTAERTVNIHNQGNAPLNVTGMTIPSGMPVTASWTSGTIQPGTIQQVLIRFAPTNFNSYSGLLTVNGDHTAGTNTVPISGRGIATPRPPFSRSGRGNSVFDMPGDVTRVRIYGRWDGRDTSNFIVHINGRSVVNEILRNDPGRVYEGVHLVPLTPRTQPSVVEIVSSGNIEEWRFTEER